MNPAQNKAPFFFIPSHSVLAAVCILAVVFSAALPARADENIFKSGVCLSVADKVSPLVRIFHGLDYEKRIRHYHRLDEATTRVYMALRDGKWKASDTGKARRLKKARTSLIKDGEVLIIADILQGLYSVLEYGPVGDRKYVVDEIAREDLPGYAEYNDPQQLEVERQHDQFYRDVTARMSKQQIQSLKDRLELCYEELHSMLWEFEEFNANRFEFECRKDPAACDPFKRREPGKHEYEKDKRRPEKKRDIASLVSQLNRVVSHRRLGCRLVD